MRVLTTAASSVLRSAFDGWVRGQRGAVPPAVILGGSVNGLSFVRSLARRGVSTLLLDSEPLIGTYTRHGDVFLLPSVSEHADLWLDALRHVAGRLERPPALFVTSDAHGVFVAQHGEELARHFAFLMPDAQTINRIVDKRRQYDAAAAAGVPIPRTFFPESADDVRALAADLAFPCILKPYKSHVGRRRIPKKVVVIPDRAGFVAAYTAVAAPGVDFMVQEIIPGGDSELYGYLAFWDHDGREAFWLTKRKLRQNPPHYGDGSLQVTVEAPEVAALSRRLLAAFGYRGFVGVEFKRDARDGTFRLMEINPRTVSGNQLAITAGVDFPWLGYRYLTGDESVLAESPRFRPDVRYVNEEWDVKAYLALRRAGKLTFREWIQSIHGAEAFAVGAWDDPGPLLAVLWRFARGALRSKGASG